MELQLIPTNWSLTVRTSVSVATNWAGRWPGLRRLLSASASTIHGPASLSTGSAEPSCPRIDCSQLAETPGAEYGFFPDTRYKSSFFFGCQPTFTLTAQSSAAWRTGIWDFGDLRCEGPVCDDPGRPPDDIQISTSYEEGSEISFRCTRPGYIPITSAPIQCVRDPEYRVVRPKGITSGRIPDGMFNATSKRRNYEARKLRMNSATGWCARPVLMPCRPAREPRPATSASRWSAKKDSAGTADCACSKPTRPSATVRPDSLGEVRDQSGPVWASVSSQTEASCATLDKDKIPPQVVRCPSDIWIETRNGSACVDWTERQRPSDPGGGDERNTLACGTYEFDRCRTLYEKFLQNGPENCTTWMKFAELETLLGDVDRARGIDELAIKPPLLDKPEIL